jgi:hypothetical protein
MANAVYEIRVVGQVSAGLLEDFETVTMSVDPVGTTMHADFTDAAELHGFLGALSRAGHVLVDVRREQVPELPHTTGQGPDFPEPRPSPA